MDRINKRAGTTVPLLVQTSLPVPKSESFDVLFVRRGLTERALKLLKMNQIQIRVDRKTGKTTRNDMDDDMVELTPHTRFVRLSNITGLVLSEHVALSLPWTSLLQTPSLVLAKFLVFPEQFAHAGNVVDDLNAFYRRKSRAQNTASTEVDSDFPALTGKTRAVIVGLQSAIREHLGGRKSYGDACRQTLESLHREKADFPILAAIDHQRIVKRDKKTHVVDFHEQTSSMGTPLLPLMLTTCSEVKSRIQLQYLEILYALGAVKLHKKPVDPGAMLYKLADDDEVSVQMGLCRSTSILYSVSVLCRFCSLSHHYLWKMGIEAADPDWLKDVRCRACGHALISRSCFVLRSRSGNIDPSSVRRLHYSLPYDFKMNRKTLPKYEHVCHMTNGSNLRLYLREDTQRKNLQGLTISATVFVPVVYKLPDIEGIEKVEETHQLMHVYAAGYEHVLPVMCTRVKMSLSCKRSSVVKTAAPPRTDLFVHLGGTFQRYSVNELRVHFPHSDTTRRLGVEVRNSLGEVERHSACVTAQLDRRVKGRRVAAKKKTVSSSMYSCQHFTGSGIGCDENNFTMYGVTVAAGLVWNFCNLRPRYEQLLPMDFKVQNLVPGVCDAERSVITKTYVNVKIANRLRIELAHEKAFSGQILKELMAAKLERTEAEDDLETFLTE